MDIMSTHLHHLNTVIVKLFFPLINGLKAIETHLTSKKRGGGGSPHPPRATNVAVSLYVAGIRQLKSGVYTWGEAIM